ncbi:thiol:disulfide interchange protein DsbA/DsbL [Candidatus Halobeggiatoa sp. HSG11]|nr:thiol:disulfide interchange protein DsbA/DsbL [Candidatus Halobeggiatoa sp. HSG11]
MRIYIKLFFICLFMMFQSSYAGDGYEGKYELLTTPQTTNAPAGKIEVVELFWYTCPHCYQFDKKHLKNWKKNKPEYVHFVHMPAVFGNNDRRIPLAKAYYVAEALQILDKINTPLFKAIHDDKHDLNSKEALQRMFSKYGVDEKDFSKTYDSFWVETQIKRAKAMTAGYEIQGVPAVIINGKYRLTSEMAKGYTEMMKVLDHLIEKEHSAK